MRSFWTIIVLLLALILSPAQAEEITSERLTAHLQVSGGEVEIVSRNLYGEEWLFLPSFAVQDYPLELFAGEEKLSWTIAQSGETSEIWQVERNGETAELHVMRSENLRSLYLFSDDPVHEGREYIDGSPGHATETTGSIAVIDTDGTVDHAGELRQLRGRGNGTWSHDKKPYQFKLEEKADLLKTGDPAEKNRTWVLLADATDPTLLHNRVTLDLALEMGMDWTSRSEHVDLYYDGDYRGTYLLTEKVQINEGRVDVVNYEDILETWNAGLTAMNPESLHVAETVNRFGNSYTYIEDIQAEGRPDLGSYLIELSVGTDEMCRFFLQENSDMVCFVKNPEVASRDMMLYVSERVQAVQQTILNNGVNPENGHTLEEEMDVDSFVRLALLAEFSYNLDAFSYSSTYFVLPAGDQRLHAGPVWDVDLAYRYHLDGRNAGGVGLKDETGWLKNLYGCEPFVRAMQRIYRDEMLPVIQNILLGEEKGTYLQPLDDYLAEIAASSRMNRRIWNGVKDHRLEYGDTYEDDVFLFRQFMEERSKWLHQAMVEHDVWDTEYLELNFKVVYGHPDELVIQAFPWTRVDIAYETEQLSEADDMDYAWYAADVYVTPLDGKAFVNPTLTVNGGEILYEILEDGTLHFAVEYEDYSYRTAYYDDVDIGLIYNYDIYMEDYPEVAEECMYDEELMMEYFCTTGMAERHIANGIFSPMDLMHDVPEANEECKSWPEYYWALLEHGYEDGWLKIIHQTFTPELSDVL